MEGVGGDFRNYANLRNNPHHHPVAPPLTAIGRFLQGQSHDDHDHVKKFMMITNRSSNVEEEEEVNNCEFSSTCNMGGENNINIGGCLLYHDDELEEYYNYSKVNSYGFPMDNKIFATPPPPHHHNGVFSKNNYENTHDQEVILEQRGSMKMKTTKGGDGCKYVIKGQWSKEEDRKLVGLVKKNGIRRWSYIAEQMIGRAGKQCRERWHNHLRPDIKKDTWSEEEERMLVEAHRKVGNKWAEIAKLIPGRSENAIKNHWNATKRRQISRRKPKKNEPKNRKLRSSILQEYIRSKNITTNANDHNITSTPNTIKATRGLSTTISSNEPSNKFNAIFPALPNPDSDDSPSLDITQSYDDELTFMQNFFGDSKPIINTQYSNSISNDSSIHIKEPTSPFDINLPLEFNANSHCHEFAPYSSMFNESVYIKDLKPLVNYGYPSSSLIFNESSLHINPNSSFEESPLGFSGNLHYGFDLSSSTIAHDDNSNLFLNQEDSLNIQQLASDVKYISNLLEGSTTTTLSNYSSDHYGNYYGGTKRDMMVFDAHEQSFGSSGSSSNEEKEMDLVKMLSSHDEFSQGSNFMI